MNVENLIGLSKDELIKVCANDIYYVNNVNSTVEVCNVETTFTSTPCHMFVYFDLMNNNIMTMAILKIESMTLISRLKLKVKPTKACNGYISVVTPIKKKGVFLTYVKDNIFKYL